MREAMGGRLHLLVLWWLSTSVSAWIVYRDATPQYGKTRIKPTRSFHRSTTTSSCSHLVSLPVLEAPDMAAGRIDDDDQRSTTTTALPTFHKDLEVVFCRYGLPWQSSLGPLNETTKASQAAAPFFQPFFEWQLDFMRRHLHNLHVVPTQDRSGTRDLTYIDNLQENHGETKKTKKRPHRMITLCFSSDEYRLIRMTLLDGGRAVQVFTSLWYPQTTVNLPVLGIDLLQFANATRHLTVIDFQPIQSSEDHHDVPYENLLAPIRDRYPSLQTNMSKRFYDSNDGFFSNQMLLGKGNCTDYVWSDLWPAYQEYVQTHVQLVQQCCCNNNKQERQQVDTVGWHGQKRYDDYSSVRDPAHGLLANIFGRDYADDFVYDVLFPLCDRPDTDDR